MPTVAEIHVYPVKACRGIPLDSAVVTASGIDWDRRWMFVDADGTFISQRTHPQLARIETALTSDALVLRAPGLEPLTVPLAEGGEPLAVRVWKDNCEALDQGEEAARWAVGAVGANVRLVRAATDTGRRASREYAGEIIAPVTFADAFPLLVCNSASLAELNARMPEPVPMNRFRPNLVVDGLDAFAEDRIDTVDIGALRLRLVKPCARCVTTATDQTSGERSTNPLPVLRQFRFDRELLGVTFGENAVIEWGAGTRIGRGAACTL
jgi:uncharacterized protein YcbX